MEPKPLSVCVRTALSAVVLLLTFSNAIAAGDLSPETKKRFQSIPAHRLVIPSLTSKQQAKLYSYKANLPTSTPDSSDLKRYQTRVKNQNPRGSCPTFSFIGALEAAYIRHYGFHAGNYTTADGYAKYQQYSITNDCSLLCTTPECYAGCEEFDLSEEYYAHISLSTQSASNPLLDHENIASECFTVEETEGVDSTIMFTVSGLTVPREKYAPYFGDVNAHNGTNHSGNDYYQLMFDTGIFIKDDEGKFICNPMPTQQEIDDFNYDPRHIPPEARKNAVYGTTDLQLLSAADAQDTHLLEQAVYNLNEVDLGLGLGGLDCGNGTTYHDGSAVQTYSDGIPICQSGVHLCTNPPYGAAGCQGINEWWDSEEGKLKEVGHQMLLVGYDRTNKLFLLKNSWGESYLPYIWVPYAFIIEKSGGGYIVTGVRDPGLGPSKEAMWIGKWRMDADGQIGNLVIRRVRPMPASGAPGVYTDGGYGSNARMGSYYGADGTYHAVTGHLWSDPGSAYLYVDYDSPEGGPEPLGTPVELTGQEFELTLFTNSTNRTYGNFAAGRTTWNGQKFGTLLSRPEVVMPYESGSFSITKWIDTYKLYYSQSNDALFDVLDVGRSDGGNYYAVSAQYNGSTGNLAAIDEDNLNYLWIWGSSEDFYYHTWETGVISGPGHFGLRIVGVPYSGIWKGSADGTSFSFYIQHYSTGSTAVLYTSDLNNLYGFLSDMFGGCSFESDSLGKSKARRIRIVFSSDNEGVATITDNTKVPPTSIEIPIQKTFPAMETQRSGIWKNIAGTISLYVQDYEAGSTVVIYTRDGDGYHVFLTDMDGMMFQASNMAGSDEELTLLLTGEETGTMDLSTATGGTDQVQKLFPPVSMDVDFTGAPLSGPAPLQVQFTDLSTVTHTSWSWKFGDGGTGNEQNPKHTYSSPGTYSVSMVASFGNASTETLRSDYVQVTAPTSIAISGVVTLDGIGLAQVSLAVNGATVTTDTLGRYSAELPYGWSGAITPSLSGYRFEPPSLTYSGVTESRTNHDFVAVRDTVTVSGNVRERVLLNYFGVEGVTITFSGGEGTATTNAAGNYSKEVPVGWTGSVVPSKNGYTFDPTSVQVAGITEDMSDTDFAASKLIRTISGVVTIGTSTSGLAGVKMTGSGLVGSVTTDASGGYSLSVTYGWSATVTPSKTDYVFSPSYRSYNNVTANHQGQNYSGTILIK